MNMKNDIISVGIRDYLQEHAAGSGLTTGGFAHAEGPYASRYSFTRRGERALQLSPSDCHAAETAVHDAIVQAEKLLADKIDGCTPFWIREIGHDGKGSYRSGFSINPSSFYVVVERMEKDMTPYVRAARDDELKRYG